MTPEEIRMVALEHANRGYPGGVASNVINAARAFEAYLVGPQTDDAAGEAGDSTLSRWAESSEAASSQTVTGAAQDTAPVSPDFVCPTCGPYTPTRNSAHVCPLLDEPPVGSVVVLRSPTTGALFSAQRKSYGEESPAWHPFDVLAPLTWSDLIEGREVVAVHTPDVTS